MNFTIGYNYNQSEYNISDRADIKQNDFSYNGGIDFLIMEDLEIGYEFQSMRQRQATLTRNWVTHSNNHQFNGVWTTGNFRAEIMAQFNRLKYEAINNHFTILNTEIEYRLPNNWTIKVEGRDILNLHPKRIYSNTFEIAYYEIENYQRFGGSITIGLKKLF